MYLSLEEEQFQPLLTALTESSKSTKSIVVLYFIFLVIAFFSLINISNLNYFNNEITIFVYAFPVSVDFLIFWLPYAILICHIYTIEAMLRYYEKINKFILLKTKLSFDDDKTMYLPSFVLNYIDFYKENTIKGLVPFLFIMTIFMVPVLILLLVLGYTNSPYSILFFVIGIVAYNIYFMYKLSKVANTVKQKIFKSLALIILGLSLLSLIFIPFYLQKPLLEIEKSISNQFKNVDDNKNSTKYLSFPKYFLYENLDQPTESAKSKQNKSIEKRGLDNILFYNSNLQNLSIKYSSLNHMIFYKLSMTKNILFNTALTNSTFQNVTMEEQNFIGDIITQNISMIFLPFLNKDLDEFKYKTILKNIIFYSENTIENSRYENVKFENVKLLGVNNIISNSEFKNVVFIDFQNFSSTNSIVNSNFMLSTFRNSNLSNLKIENSKFVNTEFHNVSTIKTVFLNCKFEYSNRESYERNKDFFKEKEKFKGNFLIIKNEIETF